MRFLNRTLEMGRLDDLAQRRGGGLAVIWGRRRIGKTRLLLEWVTKHDGLYTVADQSSPDVQRRYFAEALGSRFRGFGEAVYSDWGALLRRVAQEAAGQRWRGPLVLDEFPYLATASPELPSILQRWLENEAASAGLTVALAGSSQHMMQGLVLSPNAPLFGRASEAIQLEPMMAGYLREGLKLSDPLDCVRAHAAWGGVPRYWELAAEYPESLEAAVDRCVLDPLGPLHREPDRLLREEMPPAVSLRPILDVIGMGAHRLSEIAGRVGQQATSLTRPITRLLDLGLLERQRPYGQPEKTGKRSLYRIADPFFRMWFRVVAPHRALLAQVPRRARLRLWREACVRLYAETWEDLCRASIARLLNGSLAKAGPWGPAGRYWSAGGPEWDIVSLSADGRRLLLGEVKWSERAVTATGIRKILGQLRAKGVPPVAGREVEVVHAVFVPRMAKRTVSIDGCYLVDAAKVLAALRQEPDISQG
jgi:uncharacterized protein